MTHEDCRPISQDVLAVIFYNQPILDKQKKCIDSQTHFNTHSTTFGIYVEI